MVCEQLPDLAAEPLTKDCLNPCFTGIWSARLRPGPNYPPFHDGVLILVLLEYGLRALQAGGKPNSLIVLILVLLEYGLRELKVKLLPQKVTS